MLVHPQFDPVLFSLGPLSVRWYGLMYLAGFLSGLFLGKYRARQKAGWNSEQVDDLLFFTVLGIIIGGRCGYVLFYHFDLFLQNPLYLFRVWEGGMSFHGGFLGVCVAVWLFARKHHKKLWSVADFIAPLVPPGLGFGRLGNFINGELWGRPTDMPWGMVFPEVDQIPRHPNPLYEFAGEGVFLFLFLWWYSSKPRPRSSVSGMFMLGYGCIRTCIEFFREPDAQLGFIAFHFVTMGMLLSVPMIIIGAVLVIRAYRSGQPAE